MLEPERWIITAICFCVTSTMFYVTVLSLPSKLKTRLRTFFEESPIAPVVAYWGRELFLGRLSSRCCVPDGIRAQPMSCSRILVDWIPTTPPNLFHEESYVVAWRCEEAAKKGLDWVEEDVEITSEERPNKDNRWRFVVSDLPEEMRIEVRVAAINRRGRSCWSETLSAMTYAQPNSDGGYCGPIGPAGSAPRADRLYFWGQTKKEVTLKVPVPANYTAKDINVKVSRDELQIRYTGGGDGGEEILIGRFPFTVMPDELLWEMEKNHEYGRHLSVQLEKLEKKGEPSKWHCFVEGDDHPCIDVTLLDF